jgi:hypothetical protein
MNISSIARHDDGIHQKHCYPTMCASNKCSELDERVEWADYAYCERDGIAHVPAAEIAVDVDAGAAVAVESVAEELAAAAVAAACYIDILVLDTARRRTLGARAFLKWLKKEEF